MIDHVEKLMGRLIGTEISKCPGEEPHSTVSPAPLALLLATLIALGFWAFNLHADQLFDLEESNKTKLTYGQMSQQLTVLMNAQNKQQQASLKTIAQQLQGQQQLQQQLTTNQGDLIKTVAAMQSAVNILLSEKHPDAFININRKTDLIEEQQTTQLKMLLATQTKQFVSLLTNVNNPIAVDTNSALYTITSESGDIDYMFMETDKGYVELLLDAQSYVTDVQWSIVEEYLAIRAQVMDEVTDGVQ